MSLLNKSVLLCFLLVLPGLSPAKAETLTVFVSIPPQAWLLEQLGSDRLDVKAMLGPNANPHNYDPVPRQLVSLADARLYFTIGIPFESMWRERLTAVNPQMEFVHCGSRDVAYSDHAHDHDHEGHRSPHIWTSPLEASAIAKCMHAALLVHDPQGTDVYSDNLEQLQSRLHELDREIRGRLAGLDRRYLLVQHPAWDYFADAYGFIQLAIEKDGHEPNARHLVQIIEQARELDLYTIFVQRQYSPAAARLVADAIGARIVEADPMARDYPAALRHLASSLAEP